MPRPPLIRTDHFPYHVTARANNKERFWLPLDEMWELLQQELAHAQNRYDVVLGPLVLMNNHYHLLIKTPQANIDTVMQFLQKSVSRKANKSTGRINHLFGGPYYWSVVQENRYLWGVIRYILQNPLRAGLCKGCEEYPYSTLHHQVSGHPLKFELGLEKLLGGKVELPELLRFVNESIPEQSVSDYRNALKRTVFGPRRDPKTGFKLTL